MNKCMQDDVPLKKVSQCLLTFFSLSLSAERIPIKLVQLVLAKSSLVGNNYI